MRTLSESGYRVLLAHGDEAVLESVSDFLRQRDESISVDTATKPEEGEVICGVGRIK